MARTHDLTVVRQTFYHRAITPVRVNSLIERTGDYLRGGLIELLKHANMFYNMHSTANMNEQETVKENWKTSTNLLHSQRIKNQVPVLYKNTNVQTNKLGQEE